jgi:hypothetical protein
MFIVAAAGITRLWIQQRRERAHLETVDGFRESLESIQPVFAPAPRSERKARPARPEAAPASPAPTVRRATRPIRTAVPRYKPLEPERRAAAKRRLEARRKARARAAL